MVSWESSTKKPSRSPVTPPNCLRVMERYHQNSKPAPTAAAAAASRPCQPPHSPPRPSSRIRDQAVSAVPSMATPRAARLAKRTPRVLEGV